MAALTLFNPTTAGTIVAPAAATASDTIAQAVLGVRGVNLRIATAGTTSNVTISDASLTPGASNPATTSAIAMAATQVRVVYISPAQCAAGGNVTITSSSQTNLTYEVYPA
jgi:hypothetical protein